MVGRISVQFIACLLLFVVIPPAAPNPNTLVSYSFDEGDLSTGPDTFAVFAHAKGTVSLSHNLRYSGYSSIEIRDVAGDKDFPELQGYFSSRDHGQLFVHFAFLVTDPHQEFNIALAGPRWFTLRKDGIALWLKSEDGVLFHVSDSIPKKLFPLVSFVWYLIDIRYDIGAGIYDLTLHEESKSTPIVSLVNQRNASNQPGSAVDKFSFIGDTGEDTSNVVYYVDDVIVSADEAVMQLPFVAPGRRKLFVDYWNEAHQQAAQHPQNLPAVSLADFGISHREALALQQQDALKFVGELAAGKTLSPEGWKLLSSANASLLRAMTSWNAGRKKLEDSEAAEALALFEDALQKVPAGKIYELYRVLALVSLKRWQEVDLQLSQLGSSMSGDPRYGVISAQAGLARGNLDEALRWLGQPARDIPEKWNSAAFRAIWVGPITPDKVKTLRSEFPEHWQELIEEPLIAEEYYFVLLWKNRLFDAEQFASGLVEKLKPLKLEPSKWREYAGDAAFLSGNLTQALHWYEASQQGNDLPASVLLKLSDVYFRLGDQQQERSYREKIYGRLATP